MTRLQPDDISDIAYRLEAYDEELRQRTGCDLRRLACHAVGLKAEDVRGIIAGTRTGVVPIRWGQGLIGGFSEATAAILKHLGFDTFVTTRADISGLTEAYTSGADAVFLSDDHDFVAINTAGRRCVHNADATGRGFAAGLDLMAGGVTGRSALVLGCGPVGRSAALTLLNHGAKVSTFDIDSRSCREFKETLAGADAERLISADDIDRALNTHELIVDATSAAGIIQAAHISPQTLVAAPGMPLGLSRSALEKVSDRLLHDPLHLGVATMGMEIVKQFIQSNHHDRK